MQIEITSTSPTYGGGNLRLVGEFLLDGVPDSGGSIERIEVDLLVRAEPRAPRIRAVDEPTDEEVAALMAELGMEFEPSDTDDTTADMGIGPDDPGWGQWHEEARAKGPSLRFHRGASRVALRVISDLSELDVFGTDDPAPEVFATAAREVVSGLADLPRRIRASDGFDGTAFLAHLRSRLDVVPQTQEHLDAALAPLAEAAQRRRQAMSAWEVVDVDWSLYAPGARERLDDPFFFDHGDDESPHGNDSGTDLLAAYLDERPDDGFRFLVRQVGESGRSSLEELLESDSWEHDELAIAAVFAELMVRGTTSSALKQLALQALDRRDAISESPRTAQLRAALG